MYHLVDNFQDKAGNALVGYYVKLKVPGGAYATLYADTSSTPIVSVSGVADAAVTDANGMYDIYVDEGDYETEFFDKNDINQRILTISSRPMFANTSATTALGRLADTAEGAALVGFVQSGAGAVSRTVQAKLLERVSVTDFGAVGDGVTNDTAAIVAALAAHDVVIVPAGTFAIGSAINIPAGKALQGAGIGKTIFKFLPAMSPRLGGAFILNDKSVARDFSVEGEYVGWGGGAAARTHVFVGKGKKWLGENLSVRNAYGYHFWANSGTTGVYSSGTFRNVYSENANVMFETTNADGVLFDGFFGTSGDSAAPGYANLGNEGIHPISDSQNITYRHGRITCQGNAISISNAAVSTAQIGLVLDDVEITTTDNSLPCGIIVGTASYSNTVVFNNVRLTKPEGGGPALEVTHSSLKMIGCRGRGGGIGVFANTGATVEGVGSFTEGQTNPAGASVAYGLFGTGTINWIGGSARAVGPSGSAAYTGDVSVSGGTEVFPAVVGSGAVIKTISARTNTTAVGIGAGYTQITKTGGVADTYDADMTSDALTGDFTAEIMMPAVASIVFGVSADPTVSTSFTDILHGFAFANDRTVYRMQSGALGSVISAFMAGERFWIRREGTTSSLLRGTNPDTAEVLDTFTVSGTVYLDCSIYASGAQFIARLMEP